MSVVAGNERRDQRLRAPQPTARGLFARPLGARALSTRTRRAHPRDGPRGTHAALERRRGARARCRAPHRADRRLPAAAARARRRCHVVRGGERRRQATARTAPRRRAGRPAQPGGQHRSSSRVSRHP